MSIIKNIIFPQFNYFFLFFLHCLLIKQIENENKKVIPLSKEGHCSSHYCTKEENKNGKRQLAIEIV